MNLIDFEIDNFSFQIKVLNSLLRGNFSPEYPLIIKTTPRFYYLEGGDVNIKVKGITVVKLVFDFSNYGL